MHRERPARPGGCRGPRPTRRRPTPSRPRAPTGRQRPPPGPRYWTTKRMKTPHALGAAARHRPADPDAVGMPRGVADVDRRPRARAAANRRPRTTRAQAPAREKKPAPGRRRWRSSGSRPQDTFGPAQVSALCCDASARPARRRVMESTGTSVGARGGALASPLLLRRALPTGVCRRPLLLRRHAPARPGGFRGHHRAAPSSARSAGGAPSTPAGARSAPGSSRSRATRPSTSCAGAGARSRWPLEPADVEAAADGHAEAAVRRATVRAALARLEPRERELIALRFTRD